ncbi:MAG: RNA polymerase subunit sigma-24, partial [Candidatus Competibacteraceae bacterium]|nr:RNA polymerase subunit sigma-24 [Candidatus Competibacteraceae bacterium]
QQQAEHLLNALAELPEAQRETFLLKAEGGLSLDEIATATAVNRETAKSRLRYAVSRLKTLLGAQP